MPGTSRGSPGSTASTWSNSSPNTDRTRCSATGSGRRLTPLSPAERSSVVLISSASLLLLRCSSLHSGRRERTSSTWPASGASRLSVAAMRRRWMRLMFCSSGKALQRLNSRRSTRSYRESRAFGFEALALLAPLSTERSDCGSCIPPSSTTASHARSTISSAVSPACSGITTSGGFTPLMTLLNPRTA